MLKVNAASLHDSATHYEAMAAAHASPPNAAEAKKHAVVAANAAAELESIDPRWHVVEHIDISKFCAAHGITRPRRPSLPPGPGRNRSSRAARSSGGVRTWRRSSALANAWAAPVDLGTHLDFSLAAAQVRAAARDEDVTEAARTVLERLSKSDNPELLAVLRAHPNYVQLMPKAA